jgi:hypothetical protein
MTFVQTSTRTLRESEALVVESQPVQSNPAPQYDPAEASFPPASKATEIKSASEPKQPAPYLCVTF